MRVREIEHGLTLATPSVGYVRTPGLHASDLYGAFYRSFDPKRYDKRLEDGSPQPMDTLKLELGTSFEEVLEEALARRLFGERPGEFVSPEGIIFSPDYLFDIDGELVLGEFKLTWYSAKDAPHHEKFEKYFTQIKMYCHWLQLTKARLYILFVNNDYKPPTPKLRAWELQFSPTELAEETEMVLRHAREQGLL